MLAALDAFAQARKRQQVVEAVRDVRLFEPYQVLGLGKVAARTELFQRRRHQRHPFADEVAGRERLGVLGESLHATALRVAEHHDVLHLQRRDAELERRRDAMRLPVRRVGRHEVRDIAHDEQLARPRVEDHLRRDARVGAADHHDLRRLPLLGKLAIAALLQRQAGAQEIAIALDEALREAHDATAASLARSTFAPHSSTPTFSSARGL